MRISTAILTMLASTAFAAGEFRAKVVLMNDDDSPWSDEYEILFTQEKGKAMKIKNDFAFTIKGFGLGMFIHENEVSSNDCSLAGAMYTPEGAEELVLSSSQQWGDLGTIPDDGFIDTTNDIALLDG